MNKFKLFCMILLVVSYIAALWIIPISLVVVAFTLINTLWIKILLCVVAAIWTTFTQPWTIFCDEYFSEFKSDFRYILGALFSSRHLS